MLETNNQISLMVMEKVLKHLPEPTLLEVTLNNFDYSDIHTQASKIAEKLEIKLNKIGYISIDAKVLEPSKEKILKIYRSDSRRTGAEIDPRFISFKKAEWRSANLNIDLYPFSIHVVCCDKIPDYIEKMREGIKGDFVDYKIELKPTLY